MLWQLLPLPQWQGSTRHGSSSELPQDSAGLQMFSAAGAVGVLQQVGLTCLAPVASHLLPEQFVFIPSALYLVLLSCSFQSEWSSCLQPQNMTEFRIPADICTPRSLENSTQGACSHSLFYCWDMQLPRSHLLCLSLCQV